MFNEVWIIDSEFSSPSGELPTPVCLVGKEIMSGEVMRIWFEEGKPQSVPFSCNSDSLVVAYFASAEWGTFLSLGWPLPANMLDLYAEFVNMTASTQRIAGSGLLGAATYFGVPHGTSDEKSEGRDLVMQGGPWSPDEKENILRYCESDVDATVGIYHAIVRYLSDPDSFQRALLRGRYTAAVARMERAGVPIDVDILHLLRSQWDGLKSDLIREIDANYHVYEGGSFREHLWEDYLHEKGIPWPRLPSGRLRLDDGTFKSIAQSHPEVQPIRDLRYILGQLKLHDIAVGSDGRNRTLLSPFGTKTGRNAPSTVKFIFGPAVWLRSLIRPKRGMALAYIDYEQQEFGIAAALSGDDRMQKAYLSGDPYLSFAKQAGAVPPEATKESHKRERDMFKQCVLAVQYGMGPKSLAAKITKPIPYAEELLDFHRASYPVFWEWSDRVVTFAKLHSYLNTAFGWRLIVTPDTKERTIRNFLMQANGAEILRLACIFVTESGIRVCAPIHDAILIEAQEDEIEGAVRKTQDLMERAGKIVLDGFPLRSDVEIIRYPDRYTDPRGVEMWNRVCRHLGVAGV